jgi:hypothetical protein
MRALVRSAILALAAVACIAASPRRVEALLDLGAVRRTKGDTHTTPHHTECMQSEEEGEHCIRR